MSNTDIQQLTKLAKSKMKIKVSESEALYSFVSAGILNKNGKFTKQYNNLNKLVINK